jgi:hypothetical protein
MYLFFNKPLYIVNFGVETMKSEYTKYRLEICYRLVKDEEQEGPPLTWKKTLRNIRTDNPSGLLAFIGSYTTSLIKRKRPHFFLRRMAGYVMRFINTWRITYREF